MNLGELIVELCADTAQLEKSLEQAKKKAYEAAASIEKSFDKINLEINVDDDSLTSLNKHLNLKVQHLKEVNKYFNNNPIVVNVDDDQLVDLNKHLNLKVQHLKEVNKYFNSNPIIAKVNIEDDGLTELQNKLNNLHQKKVVVSVDLNDNTFSSVSFNFSNSDNNFAIINQLRSINKSINSISQSIIFVNTSIITGNNLIVEAINNLGTANNTTSNAVKSDTKDIDREQSALSQQQSQGTRAIVDNSSKEVVNQLKSVKKSIITTAKPDIKQSLATGVTEEFGRVIGKNLMLGFKKNLGVDLAGATQSFTKVISKPFAKVTPESIQKFEDEIVSALEDAFVFNNQSQAESKFRKAFQPIVDEILEIAFTATGQILGVAAQPLRIRKRVLLAQSAQDSAKLSESIPVPNDNENIKKAKSISLITGGIDFQKGGLNTFFAENLVKRILPGSYSVPVTNPYSNDKSNLGQIYQFRAKLSNEMIIGADGIARPSSEPMPLDMLLHTNIEKGYNPDSIKMAAEAMAYRKKYPDKPIQLLGTSGGSYIVEEAIAILERAGIKNIKGLGLTAPVNDLMTTANRKNYKSLVGEFDPLNVAMFGGKNVQDKDHPVYIATKKEIPFGLPGLLKESPLMSLIPSAGKGHALLPFLTKPMVVEQIQSFLGEAIDLISPAFSKGIKSEPNLHFYKFQQDEKNALVKTFKAILGDGSTLKQIEKAGFIGSEGYTFAVPQRPEWRRENDFSAMMGNLPNPKSISKEIKPEFDEYLSFLKEMRLGIVEFLDSGAKSRQSLITALEQAIRFYPELKTLQFRVLETLEEQARLTDLNKNSKTDIRTARERYKDNQRLARINTQFPQGQEYLKDFKNREKDVKLSPKITQIDSSKPKNQSAESLLHASNPDDIKDIGLPKNLSNVPDLVDSTDSALNQAAIKLENAASLLIDAVNSLNNLVANLKVSSLNTQKTQFQSVVSRQKKASLSNSLEFNAISSTTPEPIKKQLEAIQSGLIKGVNLSQRYKDATQAENNAAVPDLTQSSIIEQIKKESDISLNEIKVALDTINKIFSAEYKELAAEFEVSKKSGNLDIIKATKNKLREFISRSKEAITTIDKYVDIGRQAGFETSFNSELTSIKRKGKSGIRKNEEATDEKVGRLNYIEVELYNAKLTEQIALAEQQGVDIGKHINDGLKNGIKHNIDGVSDEAKKMLNDLIATIKDTLDIQSPSKVMFDIGKNVITGLLFGFIDNLTVLKQVAKQIPNTVINTVEKGFEIQSPSLWGWRTGKNIGDTIGNSAVRSLFLANLRIAKMLDTIKEHEIDIRPYLVGSQVRLIETGQDNRLSERQKEKITDYLSNTKDILNRVLIDPISADPNEQIRELTANLQRARNILIQKVSDSVVSAIISIANNTSGQNTLFGTRYNKFAMQPGRAIRSLPASVDYRHNNAIRNRLFETQQQGQSSINYYNESIRARLREIEQPIRYTRRLPAAAAPIGLLPSSNIWDRPIDFSQVQQQRPTATSVPTIIPMLPPARTQRIAGYFGLSELDRRNRAVLDRRNARNRLRELQNQVEQTIDVDFEPVVPQPQQRTTPVTSRQSLPQLPSFLSSTRQQIPRSTISDILSFVISRTSQRTTSPQLPNLTQTATQQPQQPQSPSFTISGASRQSRPPQLPSFLSSTTQQIPQTQQPLSSPSFVISNVSPRNTSRSLQLPNFSQIGTQPSPSIQSTQQTATLPNVTQIAQPITQPVNFTPKYEKNWLVRLGIQMGRIVGEGFKTAFEMFGNKTFQALVKEVNKIKSAVENNTISLDAEAIRAGMSRGFKKGFNSIKGIKDIKKEFDTYIDFFQKVATPNVSSALGEGFGNNLVGMKELLIDFIDLPNKIKEGFNQAKLAVESFLQGFNKVPEIKKITDFLTNPKALGEAFGRNVVVVKKFIDSLQIPKNTIDGFKTAKAAVSDFLSGMNQIPEFKKLTDIFKDGTLRGKFSFDIGKGFGENLVKVKNFFDTLLIPKKFSDGLKEAKSLLSDFLSGLNAVPQIRKFVDSFKDQPSRFNKIANLGEGFGENIVKVKNFFDSLLIPKNFSEGLKEARMSLFVFLEGMKRVPEIKGFIDFLKSPMELGKAFGENIVNAKKFLDSLEAPTNLIDGFKKAKFALSDFLKGMKEVEGFGDVLKVLKGSISTIIGAIGLLFAGKFLLDFAPTFLKNSIDVASRMEVVGTSIKAVSTSTADAAKNMKEFSKQSNDLALDKFTFFEGAATFLGATKDTPLEGEVSRRMLNEFSVMVRARNLSKDQQQRALLALGQMASSGTIMTQDLKLQLAQAVPGAYQTFARSMGLNPQQLRKQLSLGNIQSEDLVKFTQQAYAENIGSLPNALDSYQAATDRLGNSLINVQQKVGDALLPIAKIFANIGSSLLNLIEFLIPRLVTLAIASIVSITIKLLTIPGALTLVKFGITGLISGIGMLTKALISLGAIYVVTEIAVQLGKLVWILGTDLTGELGKQIDRQTKLIQEYRQLQSNQNTQPRERYEDNWQNRIWNSLPFVGDESKNIEAVKTLWNTFTKIQTAGRSNTKAINAQAEDLVSTGQFEDLNKIDAKIESTQAKQKAILQLDPGNFKDFNLMQKELDDLLLSRQVLITSIAPLQSNIAAEIETKKQIIDWLKQNKNNPILSENEAKAFNDELDFAKNQLIVLENLQNNLTKAISKSGTAYEIMQKQLRTVSFTLEDKKAQIEANKAQKLTGITSQVFTNKMTPGELKYQTDNLNVQSLQEGIRNITNSISGYRAVFQSFEATKVLDAFNITESTGISELEKTITLVEDEKSKYVLNQFLDFLKLKRSLVDANLQTSQAQQAARQALIDQTKQVAEYYRTSVREAQAAGIEFEKARITLEGSKIQNRLRQALIGAGNNIYTQFVEGIINIITKSTEIEKRELDFRKQQIDYRNNLDNIKLRAAELQQNLPGKIIPFDEEKIKNFNNQLKIVNSSVSSTNSQTQKVVRNIGNDAVNATNSLNNSFVSVSKTIDKIGEKIDSLSVKLQSTPKLFVNPSVGSVDWFDPSLGLPQSQQIIPIAPEPARQLVPPVPPVPMSSIKLPSNIDPVQVASLPGVPIQIAQFQKLSRDPKRNFKGTGSFTSPSGQTPMVTPKPMVKPGTKPKLVRPTKPMIKPGTKPKLVRSVAKPKLVRPVKPMIKPGTKPKLVRSVAKPKLVRPVKPMVSPKPTGLSSQLMEMVKRFEGFNPKAYSDYNQYSIGYGTIAKSKNERISRAEASKRLSQELLDAQNQVKRLVKVPLNVNQLDALTSLTFNVGQGALKRSALLAKLNTGDYVAAANEFAKLNKADRVSKDVAKALTARRLKEKALFNTTPPPTAPIYQNTDGVDKPTIVEKAKPTVVEFVNPNVVTPAVTSNLRKLDDAVLNRKDLPQDELQRRINEASILYGVTEAVKNVANESNYLAQANTDKLQQQLDLYRLIQQTTESIYQALSGIADLKLDNARTIIEGLSPDMSPMDRMELDAADYERSLQRKREGYEKNIRDAGDSLQNQNPVIKRLIDVELAKKFPNSVELRGYVSRLTDKTSQVNAMQLLANTEALRQLDANLPNMVQAFRNKREAEEASRVFGLQMQDAKSALDVEQKRTEQLKVLQTLDPLNPEFNKIANRESIAALDNNKIQYSEKQQAIADLLRTKQISEETAQQRLKLAEEEYFVVERTIKLRSPLEQINENTNFQNKLLERAQYLQDSSKVMLDARSALNKALGLDFRAEKIDKQLAITSQGFEFDKASIQLEDFIEKNKLASESNRLSNDQINGLRENLRLMNEYKLDAIRLQFSELGFVFKNVASGFRSGFKEFLTSTKSFGESLTDLFNSIIKSVLDSLADLASKRVTDGLFGWVAGLFGGNKGIGLGETFGVLSGSAFNANSIGFSPTPGLFDTVPTFASGGIVGALNKEKSITGRTPHLIVASEGERVLNHRETAIWNKLQSGVTGFATGGLVGTGSNGSIASRIGNTTTINVPVSVEVGSDADVDTYRLSQAVQAMVSDGIRREMRVGGSINRGNPYGR